MPHIEELTDDQREILLKAITGKPSRGNAVWGKAFEFAPQFAWDTGGQCVYGSYLASGDDLVEIYVAVERSIATRDSDCLVEFDQQHPIKAQAYRSDVRNWEQAAREFRRLVRELDV